MTGQQRSTAHARRLIAWTAFALLLGHVGLTAWFHANPFTNDPLFVQRLDEMRIRMNPSTRLIVMVGSSRTLNGFHARAIETSLTTEVQTPFVVHNFGMPSGGPEMQYVIAKRLIEAGIRPDLLLIEMSPYVLNRRSEFKLASRSIEPGRFRPDEEADLVPFGWELAPVSVWERVTPAWFTHRTALANKIRRVNPTAEIPCDAWGHYGWDLGTMSDSMRERALRKAHENIAPLLDDWTSDSPGIGIVRMLLELCKRHRIAAALVMPPEGPVVRGWYSAATRLRVREFLDRLPREVGVPLVDAWQWLDEADFNDSHHPHMDGAVKFSARLTREFLVPWFRGSEPTNGPFRTMSSPRRSP